MEIQTDIENSKYGVLNQTESERNGQRCVWQFGQGISQLSPRDRDQQLAYQPAQKWQKQVKESPRLRCHAKCGAKKLPSHTFSSRESSWPCALDSMPSIRRRIASLQKQTMKNIYARHRLTPRHLGISLVSSPACISPSRQVATAITLALFSMLSHINYLLCAEWLVVMPQIRPSSEPRAVTGHPMIMVSCEQISVVVLTLE